MSKETPSSVEGCFELFSKWIKASDDHTSKSGIYSDATVMWLMIYQRLNAGASLSQAVEEFANEECWELAGDCKRTRERSVSSNTGGYSQARANLAAETVSQACDDLFEWLINTSANCTPARPLYAVDGATVELLRSAQLARRFPLGHKHGHYPLMRILVCHHLESGLAVRPEYGSMYGNKRTGEIQLFKAMMERLPKNAVLIGDRNFGIFASSYCAQKAGLDVVFRLLDVRAKKILGKQPTHGIDQKVQWCPSRQDLKANSEISPDARLHGRVICMNVSSYRGDKVTPLYLFTTLQDPAEKIIQMYGMRWKIEIDLRTLKQTVNMKMLKVQSEDMAHKELLLGICAYNLVCAAIRSAAHKLKAQPRDFSFKRVLYALDACSRAFVRATTEQRKTQIIDRFWASVARAKHPKRSRIRVEPRALVRGQRPKYPVLDVPRELARATSFKKTKWH